jgi:hypothetical protein
MDKINKNKYIIHSLSNCSKKIRKAILQNSNKELLDAITECILNVLNGNIHIDEKFKEKLKPHSKLLRKIIETKNLKKKRALLVQKGGFLQYLIPALVSGVATIISSVISKKDKDNE